MTKKRTKLSAAIALSVSLALVGCRGSDDEGADDGADVTTEEGTDAPVGTDAPDATDAPATTAGGEAPGTTAGGEAPGTTEGGSDAPSVDCPAEEQGLTDTEIVLGGTYPLSGPVAAYASVPVGIKAWFDYLNETEGGITSGDGVTRTINWSYLDDQYAPPKTLENVRREVEQDAVWAVLNPLGTPSNTAIRDYMNEAEVPQLYVATGAAKWGNEIEDYPWTIGYQPDYESEGIAYAQYALEENPDATIGVLYANDDFGKDYLNGIREGLGDSVDQLISEVTYETTDATVDSQVGQVLGEDPDVFMLIATPQFAIQGINQVQALGYEGTRILTSVSASVGAVIANTNDGAADGWVTSTYIKDPTDPQWADDEGMTQYQEVLAGYAPDANADDGLHVYGMSVAQLFQHTLEGMETVCRASIMEAAKNLDWPDPPLLLPGIGITTGEGDGFPVQQVQLEQWNGENYEFIGELIDAASATD